MKSVEPGSAQHDRAEIRSALELLIEPGSVAELRVLGSQRGVVSGYFDDLDAMALAAGKWSAWRCARFYRANVARCST